MVALGATHSQLLEISRFNTPYYGLLFRSAVPLTSEIFHVDHEAIYADSVTMLQLKEDVFGELPDMAFRLLSKL